MERIIRQHIDFERLRRLPVFACESVLYHDFQDLYKIFSCGIPEEVRIIKQKKLEILSQSNIASIPSVSKLIFDFYDDSDFLGYVRPYLEGMTVFDYSFKDGELDIYNFLKSVKEISLLVAAIHKDPRNIIVGDLHFANILIGEDRKYHFLDMDSCLIDGLPTYTCPKVFNDYAHNRKVYINDAIATLSKNTDKLCLMLICLDIIFDVQPDVISMYKYDKKAEQIKSLKKMRELFVEILRKDMFVPEVPYIHELISDEDIAKAK